MNTQRSKELFERAKQITPGGVHSPVRAFGSVGRDPFFVERGQGAYMHDVDGNSYVDYVMSWGPLVLGHAHPKVVQAICEQAAEGTSYGACHEKEVELTELIINTVPSVEMLRLVNSGTEATLSAIRLARAVTGRNKIVKFVGCYHGHGDALLVEAGSGALTHGIPGSAGVPENTTADTLSAQYNDLSTVEELFSNFPSDIAAVILEPVVGNCGLLLPKDGFLSGLRELCTQHDALLIFDEVMTGFRVHPGGAQELYDIDPDITALGKVIGGGLPVGAYGGKQEIMEQVAPAGAMYQAGTLSGNPLAMAAGLATLNEWLRPGVFEATSGIATTVVQALRECAQGAGVPLQASAVGTMFGLFFSEEPVENYYAAKASNTKRFNRFFELCLDRGVYFAPSPFEAGFVGTAHAGEPLERTIDVLADVFPKLIE